MDNIVDRKTDQDDKSDGFGNTELHIIPLHASHHTYDNHDNAWDSYNTLEHISGGNQQDDECEEDWGYDTIKGIANKGFFSDQQRPKIISLGKYLQSSRCIFSPCFNECLEWIECRFFHWFWGIRTSDTAQELEFEEDNFTSDFTNLSFSNILVSFYRF